ncbi:MAG: VOC family protein [Balneolaceae bacterium]
MESYKTPSQTRIGHVHLKVADLHRSLEFYRDLLGFEVTMQFWPTNENGSLEMFTKALDLNDLLKEID